MRYERTLSSSIVHIANSAAAAGGYGPKRRRGGGVVVVVVVVGRKYFTWLHRFKAVMRNPVSKRPTGSGMMIRNALLFLVFALFVCSSEASRGLRLSRMFPVLDEQQQQQQQSHRRLMSGGEAGTSTTINKGGDFEEISECNLENLHECSPPAVGSQFPTFESKKEVPNGPNPLHN